MTRQELDNAEDALIGVAILKAHIDTALLLLDHRMPEQAALELRDARACAHRLKLKIMVMRWMGCPDTLNRLIKEQMAWLKRRYPM